MNHVENTLIKVLGLVYGGYSSHTARVLEIAKALRETGRYSVLFSGSGPFMKLVEQEGFEWVETPTIPLEKLLEGERKDGLFGYYDSDTVNKQYEIEFSLLKQYAPDIIIRDEFRDIAALTAKVAGVYDVYLKQANMSPYYYFRFLPKNLSWIEKTDESMDEKGINRLMRAVRTEFSKYLHEKAKNLGFTLDLNSVAGVEPDLTLIPDSEYLFSLTGIPDSYKYIGPLMVRQKQSPPEWKDQFSASQKIRILITGGTTNMFDYMRLYQDAFSGGDYCVAMFTVNSDCPQDFFHGEFRISDVLNSADLFITHGGLGSTYMGLLSGTPMIAVYSHVEQQTNAYEIQNLGIGTGLDASTVTALELRKAADNIVKDRRFSRRSKKVAEILSEEESALTLAVQYISDGYDNFVKTRRVID